MHCIFYLLSVCIIVTHTKFIISVPSHNNFHNVNQHHHHHHDHQHHSSSNSTAKNFEVAPGINYEYLYVKGNNNNDSKPTMLFLHGFPSSFHSWRHQIEYFSRQGHDCLAPNMMGYGKTYSPSNVDEYKSKSMVEHLITLLNHLQMDKVIVVGHDWGTRVASRFVLHRPERTLGVVLISGSYNAPGLFDLNRTLEATKNAFDTKLMAIGHFLKLMIQQNLLRII